MIFGIREVGNRESRFTSAQRALPRRTAAAPAAAAKSRAEIDRARGVELRRRAAAAATNRGRSCGGPPRPRARPARHNRRVLRSAAATAAATSTAATRAGHRRRVPAGRRQRLGHIARPAHRAVILTIRIDPVRHARVDRDVIHLADRQRDAQRRAHVLAGDACAGVIGETDVVRIQRVDPDVVIVAAPWDVLERDAAVRRMEKAAVGDEHFVRVAGADFDIDVVARAPDQRAHPIHGLPARAAVVGAPHRALVRRLDERVNALRIRRRDRDVDFSERRCRQPRMHDMFPRDAARRA